MKLSVKEAREEKIFVIENGKIEETNLFEFVTRSTDETTSPVGVMSRLHIRHEDYSCRYGLLNRVNNEDGLFEVWTWGVRGNNARFIESFETEEEAENYIFNRTFEYDFMTDDQRDTCFYSSKQEAESVIIERYASDFGVSEKTAKSILNHMQKAESIKEERAAKAAELSRIEKEKEVGRINEIAAVYAKMIERVETESYKETAARLSAAIGEKIESKVFHAAVKLIRK